ncbi:MAG: alkaline phosphatase family protein [Elusimicrobia bacterium]|nr:alkaline phosphatase family protein [Elusimicrobiota bacterium]
MKRTLVLSVPGLEAGFLNRLPRLSSLARHGAMRPLKPLFPALACPAQSTFLTGALPREHGGVADGWYDRESAEIRMWRQSALLVRGERVWDLARRLDENFTCAMLFWRHNMYGTADVAVTPTPVHSAEGSSFSDLYTRPAGLGGELRARLGRFPAGQFWGPFAGIESSRWIADCARYVFDAIRPTLTLARLPHLDYVLQRLGPEHPALDDELLRFDQVLDQLCRHVLSQGARVLLISEYKIESVSRAIPINRILRREGLLNVRSERSWEMLDPGGSQAFAIADHQIAHLYLQRPEQAPRIRELLERVPGVEAVLDEEGKRGMGVDHVRSGDLVAVADRRSWFSYYYWIDDAKAPDFARTSDGRKPGYDPAELFIDPGLRMARARIAFKRLKRRSGLSAALDIVPLDAGLVRGSHGRACEGAIVVSSQPRLLPNGPIEPLQIKDLMLAHVFVTETVMS